MTEQKKIKADRSLDCRGLNCPLPIFKTASLIKEIKAGQVLEIVADDQGIIKDMGAWATATGHKLLGMDQLANEIKVYVEKVN